jgi:hypothetical protein
LDVIVGNDIGWGFLVVDRKRKPTLEHVRDHVVEQQLAVNNLIMKR